MPEEHPVDAPGEACGCPGGDRCKHDGKIVRIPIRVGFILCSLGQEKLCPECVEPFGDVFMCHGSHA